MGTNNIAELMAAIKSLRKTPEGATVSICSDSQYVLKGLTEWMPGWKKKNWRNSTGKPVMNKELWVILDQEAAKRTVTVEWVRGHNGHSENEMADGLANAGLALAPK